MLYIVIQSPQDTLMATSIPIIAFRLFWRDVASDRLLSTTSNPGGLAHTKVRTCESIVVEDEQLQAEQLPQLRRNVTCDKMNTTPQYGMEKSD